MAERLRIAVLSRNFSVTGGGAERYSISVVEQLAQQHEVHVFAQMIAHDFPGVTYHKLPMPMKRPRWINQLYFAWKTARATRHGFDIVHSHENTWHGNVHTVHVLPVKHTLFAGKQGLSLALRWLKVITSPRLLAYLWLEQRRFAFAYKKKVVCASTMLKAVVARAFPDSHSMLEVVTPGVDAVPGPATQGEKINARHALGLPVDAPLLLFVGNDFAKKGLKTVLQALAKLDSAVQLLVIGHSERANDYAQQAATLGLDRRVHFQGSLQEMSVAYRAADVLVHPTLEDTYGMVVLEAMAHGLPVVVSGPQYCGIAHELCDGHGALVLLDPKDPQLWMQAIDSLIQNHQMASHLSQTSVEFAQSRTWAKTRNAYENLMLEIKL